MTWHDGVGYAALYSMTAERDGVLSLLTTKDGINYDLVTRFDIPDFPNEATIRFDSAGDMSMMVRRELGDQRGYWGKSSFPYTDWTWKKMDFRLGGPDFLYLDDGLVVMGSRSHFTSVAKTVGSTARGLYGEACVIANSALPLLTSLYLTLSLIGFFVPESALSLSTRVTTRGCPGV